MIHFWATPFLNFFAHFQKNEKIVEIGQICSDWAHIDSP